MATLITSFDGPNDTLLSSQPGWFTSSGYYNVLKLNGSGALKRDANSGDTLHVWHNTGSLNQYVKVVVGAGFVSSGETIDIVFLAASRTDFIALSHGATLTLRATQSGGIQTLAQSAVAGDEITLEYDHATKFLVVKLNGATIFNQDITYHTAARTGTNVGIGTPYVAQPATDDIFRSWESGELGGAPADTENPGLTGSLSATAKTSTSISVTGPTATDNVGVTAYEFSQDGGATWPFSETTPAHVYTGLTPLTSYDLRMRAKDAAGLTSPALSLTTSTYRAGALGSTILLTTGPVDGNPAGILYNDVATDGSDDNKWFSFRIISQTLNGGTLDIDPDGTFTFTGAASGNFTYQLEVDGVDVGSPQLVTLYDQTTYRPSGDVTTTGWTSTGSNFYDQINETPSNDASYVTSPPLGATTDPLTLDIASMSAGNYIAKFRARKTQTTGEMRMVFLGAGGASVGETAWQPVTTSFALYELPVTLTATSARVRLDVRE